MIYQIRTYNELCVSKKYFKSMDEVKIFLKTVIKKTEEFRESIKNDLPRGIRLKVSELELISGIELIKINDAICTEWRNILGEEKEISNPKSKEEKNGE